MSAGTRDKIVTIQQLAQPDSAAGSKFPVEVWSTLDWDWMSKRDFSGNEKLGDAQFLSTVETEWEMPYRSTMDPDTVDVPKVRRIVYAGRTYGIIAARKRQVPEGEAIRLYTSAQTVAA